MAKIFADGIFGCIFLTENLCILIKISWKFVCKESNSGNGLVSLSIVETTRLRTIVPDVDSLGQYTV